MFSKIIFTEPDKFNIRFSIGFFNVFPSQTSAFYRKLYEKDNNCGKYISYLIFYLTTYFSAEKQVITDRENNFLDNYICFSR